MSPTPIAFELPHNVVACSAVMLTGSMAFCAALVTVVFYGCLRRQAPVLRAMAGDVAGIELGLRHRSRRGNEPPHHKPCQRLQLGQCSGGCHPSNALRLRLVSSLFLLKDCHTCRRLLPRFPTINGGFGAGRTLLSVGRPHSVFPSCSPFAAAVMTALNRSSKTCAARDVPHAQQARMAVTHPILIPSSSLSACSVILIISATSWHVTRPRHNGVCSASGVRPLSPSLPTPFAHSVEL